jgi:hypothetical protein
VEKRGTQFRDLRVIVVTWVSLPVIGFRIALNDQIAQGKSSKIYAHPIKENTTHGVFVEPAIS